MSPQLKSFEGPDVQLVLDRIRRELGPGAKINGAEKIRVGGLLGFFAKEHYRVMVEEPDADGNGNGANPSTINQAPSFHTTANGADVFSAMAEATDDVNDVASAPPAFAAPVPAVPQVEASPVAEPPVMPRAAAPPAARPTDATADSFDSVMSRVAHTLGDGGAGDPGTGVLPTGGPATNGTPRRPEDEAAAADIAARAAVYLAENDPAQADDRIEALSRAGLDPTAVAAVAEALRRGASLEALLLDSFSRLAPALDPPRLAGSLLVVVGHGAQARQLGLALASEGGGDPTSVAYCSRHPEALLRPEDGVPADTLCARSPEEAAERAPGWRRSQAAVVVVDCAVTAAERSWARVLIGAVHPTAVWGVVDATAKSEDITAWAAALGGLDALAVDNVDATVSPAACLSAGVPVARLDGHRANAARWTATIVDRVAPCG